MYTPKLNKGYTGSVTKPVPKNKFEANWFKIFAQMEKQGINLKALFKI